MVPFLTSETAFRQNVGELVFGIDILDVDFEVQVDSIKWPVQRNSVSSGYVSHHRTSAFDNHLDYCFMVIKR